MKKLIFLTLCLMSTLGLFAQHETLFNRTRVVGAFGGPIVEMGLDSDISTSVGGGGAVVLNNFFIGGYGLGSIDFDALIDDEEIEELEIGHGGFWLGYTYRPDKLLHIYTNARIGWGAVNVRFNDNSINSFRDLDQIFVLTPEIGIELNITRWFRVAGTAGYRWVDGVNERSGLTDDDFSGGIATLHFRFGWFGNRRWSNNNNNNNY